MFFVIVLVLFGSLRVFSQPSRPEVGYPFDYVFKNLINYESREARSSEFRGKLLILDFWNTGCASCLESWPKLLRLQKKFSEEIQIILVNTLQGEQVIRNSIHSLEQREGIEMTLPIVCGDTLLDYFFPNPGVPKIVWIDQNGIYQSFTNGTYLTESIIEKILRQEPLTMFQLTLSNSKGSLIDLEPSRIQKFWEPLFVNGNGHDGESMPLISQSVLTGRIEGLLPAFWMMIRDTIANRITLTMQGSISSFYEVAYNDANFVEPRVNSDLDRLPKKVKEWRVADSRFFPYKTTGESNDAYCYAYQLTVPNTSYRRVQHLLQMDLQRYFGLAARMEKRSTDCLVLRATDTTLIRIKAKEEYSNREKRRKFGSPGHLARYLSFSVFDEYPVLDETGYKGTVRGIQVFEDIDLLNQELRGCGLEMTLQRREVEVLVVEAPEGYVFPVELEGVNSNSRRQWKYSSSD